ncbi:hypothetical protein [Nocardia phage NBR1]|uniref:endolysin n=1 Tax=Nocardia phage NBR1 TaxID=1109711 RepID=UPI00023EEDFF|nr:endolysin [Nocardia phage NBR1]AEV52273.1 hypothetical protein [Nocardia phage NBR1]
MSYAAHAGVPVRVITVPGIGELATPLPSGMLKNITDHLDPLDFALEQFNWQNEYGPVPVWNGRDYQSNLDQAVSDLCARLITVGIEVGHRVVPMGYSGGAHVLSLALERLERAGTPIPMPAIVMVSNPSRRADDPTMFPGIPGRYGITGQHGRFPMGAALIDVSNPADVICSCPPPPHPLRGFADISRHFSLADPVRWGVETLETAKRGQFQNAWRLSSLPSWWDAVALARGYLFDGQHTNWYVPRLAAVADRLKMELS